MRFALGTGLAVPRTVELSRGEMEKPWERRFTSHSERYWQ